MIFATGLHKISCYIANPLKEFMLYMILFEIGIVLINYYNILSAWILIVVLWIICPFYGFLLFMINVSVPSDM